MLCLSLVPFFSGFSVCHFCSTQPIQMLPRRCVPKRKLLLRHPSQSLKKNGPGSRGGREFSTFLFSPPGAVRLLSSSLPLRPGWWCASAINPPPPPRPRTPQHMKPPKSFDLNFFVFVLVSIFSIRQKTSNVVCLFVQSSNLLFKTFVPRLGDGIYPPVSIFYHCFGPLSVCSFVAPPQNALCYVHPVPRSSARIPYVCCQCSIICSSSSSSLCGSWSSVVVTFIFPPYIERDTEQLIYHTAYVVINPKQGHPAFTHNFASVWICT